MVNMLVEDLEWDAVHQHHLWLSDTFRVMVWDAIGEVLDEEGYDPSVGLPFIERFTSNVFRDRRQYANVYDEAVRQFVRNKGNPSLDISIPYQYDMHLDGDQWIRVHLNNYHPDDFTPEAEHEIFSSVQAQWDARDKLAEPERFLLEIPSVPTSAEEMIERDIVDTPLYRKDVYRHMVYLQMSQDHMNMEREKANVIKTGKRKQRTESPERTVGQNQSANPRRTIMLAPREAPQSQLEHTRTVHTKEYFIELRKIGRLAPSHPKSVGPNDYRFEDETRQDTISVEDDHVAFKPRLMSEMSAMFKSLVSEELGPLKSQLKSLQWTN
jgi:hypothetical protein